MILDIILIAILVLSAFIGYKKGLVGIAVSIIALLLSIVLAVFLQGSVTNYIYSNTNIGITIEGSIKNSIESEIENKENETIEKDRENTFLNMFIDTNELITPMVDETANKITMFILKGISFVGIFIIVFIICYILRMVLNIVFKLPILNSVNRLGGVSLNIVKSIFKIWILLAVVSFISFIPTFNTLIDMINSSIITKFLYDNNIIVNILKSTLNL